MWNGRVFVSIFKNSGRPVPTPRRPLSSEAYLVSSRLLPYSRENGSRSRNAPAKRFRVAVSPIACPLAAERSATGQSEKRESATFRIVTRFGKAII
ncbi:MAG: hypothetical protein KIT41_10720 [Pyrinomonadaceae bacterium]|nr:hypothetical protein [Pyrinomonadaceae bacterium]